MIDKYGKKLFIFLGCDVVYFILWVIPAIKIPALAVVFTGLGLLTLTALSFIEGEDDTFRHITGEEQWFKVAFLSGIILTLIGIVLILILRQEYMRYKKLRAVDLLHGAFCSLDNRL